MKSLVIAEKPSVARDIARVLHCSQKGNGCLEGKDYVVTWALGHLVTLADPEEYDKKYMKWEMNTLPMMPDHMKLVVIRQTGKQYNAVKTQLFRKDIGDIIIATDAGREGELVARWILDKSGCRKPIRRLWISSVTDKAIKDGFHNLKDGRAYDNLYRAAVARAEADWLVGMNGTRALTCKYNAQLSCGRVQTPTLAIIAMREEEIRSFKPKEYFGITVNAGDITWIWKDRKSGSFRTFSRERAEEIIEKVKGKALTITSVSKKPKKTYAPGLYDLTTLQREANQKYGFSAKETLNIMQRLYENHKVLTYPRTDSRYIGKDVVPTIKERLKACGTGPYRKLAGALLTRPVQVNGSFVDDKKVSDHHAIIPTEQFVQLDHMTNEERKIYDMVVRRFLSVLYPAFEYEQTSMEAEAEGFCFAAGGKTVVSSGWKEVYEGDYRDEEEDEDEDEEKLSFRERRRLRKEEKRRRKLAKKGLLDEEEDEELPPASAEKESPELQGFDDAMKDAMSSIAMGVAAVSEPEQTPDATIVMPNAEELEKAAQEAAAEPMEKTVQSSTETEQPEIPVEPETEISDSENYNNIEETESEEAEEEIPVDVNAVPKSPSVQELLAKAQAAGETPEVKTDEENKVTLLDYSDIV